MNTKGFTLIELMITITIIISLIGIGYFPYTYYMERARLETMIDTISQEWILAHREVRNGILYDTGSHAFMEFTFQKGSGTIDITLFTGGHESGIRKPYKSIVFESGIRISGFSGNNLEVNSTDVLKYRISPPYGTGAFFPSSSGIILSIGYPDGNRESRRMRDILLKPYFD